MTTPNPIRILLIDDDEEDLILFRDLLLEAREYLNRSPVAKAHEFVIEWVPTYEKGMENLTSSQTKDSTYDVCLLDYRLGGRTGLELLLEAIQKGCKIPIILLTSFGEHVIDDEAMQIGAADFIIKDQMTPHLIERSIRHSIYRAQAAESIRQKEEGIRALLDSTFEGIVVHDATGKILITNQATCLILGYEAAEVIGMSLSRLLGESCEKKILELVAETFAKGKESSNPLSRPATREGLTFECNAQNKDGTQLELEVSSKPYLHWGHQAGLTAIQNISSRKQLEAQILIQDRLASIGLLASSLAHEIGTPLGVIRGRAEYILLKSSSPAQLEKNVSVILSQIDRVSKLIRSLLSLAKGQTDHSNQEISLSMVIKDALNLVEHEARKLKIEVRNTLGGDDSLTVPLGKEPLHQVIVNLLVNSIHAIESAIKSGRSTGHQIWLSTQKDASNLILEVGDTGTGISKKNIKKLFKPFFTTKDIGVGTGLGLATSYRIVSAWGGTIQVESEEGKGTIFRISLPHRNPVSDPALQKPAMT